MAIFTVKEPIEGIARDTFENGYDLSLALFEVYKDKLLQEYHLQSRTIIDQDDEAVYYEDEFGAGIAFKQ